VLPDELATASRRIGLVLGLLRRRLPRSRILLLALLPRHEADAPHPREWPNVYSKVQMPTL
jgi:hypothetical protein